MITALLLAAALAQTSPQERPAPAQPPAQGTTVAPITVEPIRPAVRRGRSLVARTCTGCHNAQPRGVSIYAHAPPFRWMGDLSGPRLQQVAATIAAGDHDAMPAIVLTASEAEDIAAFIRTFANADEGTKKKLALPACYSRRC